MYLAQWGSYKYFKKEEFNCQHTGNNLMQHPFMEKLEILRSSVDRPFTISSGYRDTSHPIEAKKEKAGFHTKGIACDILANHKHALDIISKAYDMGFTVIGVKQKGDYGGIFIHLDIRETDSPVLWSY